jgi:hypothetical protein
MRVDLTFASLAALAAALSGTPAAASDSPLGTWARKAVAGKPAMTMTIEAWGAGRAKLTYHIGAGKTLTVASALDGSDADVLMDGKPSGETMAIKLVDKRHTVTILKMNGKAFGTSKAAFSGDFDTLTVENDFSASLNGNTAGKATETWVRARP